MRIAIMQPYFYPYAGYFRLLYSADIFVALDCVQFPRRGWVHRNQLHDQTGQRNWISLPLLKSNRDTTRICDLKFNSDAKKLFLDQSRRFPCLTHIERTNHSLYDLLTNFELDPVTYIINHIKLVNNWLGIEKEIIRSSSLPIPTDLHGQDRIIAITKELGGKEYINLSGGRKIYSGEAFTQEGLSLRFLQEYSGSFDSMLERILSQEAESIKSELIENTIFLDP